MSEFAAHLARRVLEKCGPYAPGTEILDALEDAVWRASNPTGGVDMQAYDMLRAEVARIIEDVRGGRASDVGTYEHDREPDAEALACWRAGEQDIDMARRVLGTLGGIYGTARGRKILRQVIAEMGMDALSGYATLRLAELHVGGLPNDDLPF